MCKEFGVNLLTQIPIDVELLNSCDKGKCYMKEYPEKTTSKCFKSIIDAII
jgi:hypothetical protein